MPAERARAAPGARVVACFGGMVFLGGAERVTFAALEALVAAGASVHCVLNGWEFHRIAAEADRIGATWSTSSYREPLELRWRGPRALLRQWTDHLRATRDVLRALARPRATHVLVPAHDVAIRIWPALLVARLTGRRVVLMMHTVPADTRFYRWLWRWVVNPVVSEFVCNSAFTRAELARTGVPAGKSRLVYCAAPARAAAAATPPAPAGELIFVGQVIPPKGLHVLVEAVAVLARRGLDVRLDVVGEVDGWISPVYGSYREDLKARVRQPDLAGRVRWLGWREDVPELLRGALVHCCPSLPEIREAFGLVVLEAKLAGLPSVVFPSGALPEIVTDGEDGLVCAEPTAAAMADACARLLRDADGRRRMGQAARRSAAGFSRERFDAAWRAIVGLPDPVAVPAARDGAA